MPDLHYSEADGRLYPCEGCDCIFLRREPGDMADLQNLCRRCASEVAAQLSAEYNLPLGCSDEERQLAMNPPEGRTTWVFRCDNIPCAAWNRTWSTVLTVGEWTSRYGRSYYCFLCGHPSTFIRSWEPSRA